LLVPPLQHREGAQECALGRGLVAREHVELARVGERLEPGAGAVEERRLRPRGTPEPPGRVPDRLDEQRLPVVPGRQVSPHRRSQPLKIAGVLLENDVAPRGQPMAQCIPARGCLAQGGLGTRAFSGITAVGGDLGGGGHALALSCGLAGDTL
jgi:hypothetical protein